MQEQKESKLKFGLLQLDIVWQDVDANLAMLTQQIEQNSAYDILVLPEMFATGFTMDVITYAEPMNGKIVTWMKDQSRIHNIGIMGTVSICCDDKYYNRAIFVHSGTVSYYDKRHLFSMGTEDEFFTSGIDKVFFEFKGIKILPIICYDLRFPAWIRNQNNYDVVICMANWPRARVLVWDTLLKARAIENQSYVIGVNRIGVGDGIKYNGHSTLIDSKGEALAFMECDETSLEVVELDFENQNKFRSKFPVLNDADNFTIH